MKYLWLTIVCFYSCFVIAEQHHPQIDSKRAEFNFVMFCQGCHGRQGAGRPGNVPRVKDFIGNFLRVEGGREFLVQVPGSAFSSLDNKSLAELLNWMLLELSPNETPKDFVLYKQKEVGKLRASALTEVDELRAKLIKTMQSQGIDVAENSGS
jgi:hypothetical protein